MPVTTLSLGNLSPDVTDSDLREVFAAYGVIRSLRILERRRIAFVELEDIEAVKAVDSLKGTQLKGRTLDIAIDRERGQRAGHRPKSGYRHRRR